MKSRYHTDQHCDEIPSFVKRVWRFQEMRGQPHPGHPQFLYWTLFYEEATPTNPKDFNGYVMFMTGKWGTPIGFVSKFEPDFSPSPSGLIHYPYEVSPRLEDAIVCASRPDALAFSQTIDNRVGQLKESSTLFKLYLKDSLQHIENETLAVIKAVWPGYNSAGVEP